MPDSFRYGVATADHQCEAYDGHDDVRDVWERVRGLMPRGRATDFWNRYREDVDLAKGLGCRAFRLSLSWARLEPQPGSWDDEAFAHYRDVLQYLRAADMATVVTLHHNTWPLHVQAAGGGAGMLDAKFPERLASYAAEVAKRLGDLIDYYVTLNEPNQLVYGYIKGFWMRDYPVPPGLPPFATSDEQMNAVLTLIPNLFRAHAQARAAIRTARPAAKVGANPLVLGLPRWLQHIVDRNATHLRSPEQARRQAARLSQPLVLERGAVDISIAQITMTQKRMDDVLFSEPYFAARPAALRSASKKLPEPLAAFNGRAGAIADSPQAARVGGIFPDASLTFYDDVPSAVAALRAGAIDLIFDDDVMLRQFASDGYELSAIPGNEQFFAVAMAFGCRTLLNAVDRAIREYKKKHPDLPQRFNRKTIADIGKPDAEQKKRRVPDLDKSLQAIRKRGVLRVGIHPGVEGLCVKDAAGNYSGLEPDLAREIAAYIFQSPNAKIQFVPLSGKQRIGATRSLLRVLDNFRKSLGMFGTLVGTNWWNLGMQGKLPAFLCPPECIGTLDYVGVDYYWGVPSFWPGELHRLAAAAECRYATAPVWPNVLDAILHEAQEQFPGKPIVVIENGCVTSADGFSRAKYLSAHINQVQRAVREGVPIDAYLCWSITSNREWGLPFDDNSDFGLYHIDLDRDATLTRVPTEASARYAQIISGSAPTDSDR